MDSWNNRFGNIKKEVSFSQGLYGIGFISMGGYLAYLKVSGRTIVDSEGMTINIIPGKKVISINDITKIEIILSAKKHKVKRVNIYFSQSHFSTIQIEKADEFAAQLQRLNPKIQVERTVRSV